MTNSFSRAALILPLVLSCSTPNIYPAAVVTSFVESCAVNGGSRSACECAIEYLQQRLSIEEYAKWELQVKTGQPEDPKFVALFEESVKACQGK